MVFIAKTIEDYAAEQDIEKILESRAKARTLLNEIKAVIKPGIKESKAYSLTEEIYKKHNVTKSWHKPYIRFGENTLLTYADRAEEDLVLKEEDIAFIDIGPIFGDIEADLGETLVFGNNKIHQELKQASKELFKEGDNFYKDKNPSGSEMYDFLVEKTKSYGFEFNLGNCGHLIGLFSHSACYKDGMRYFTEKMQPGIWILEIQIRHPEIKAGAFFEDILLQN
ncbi:MAG: aminopeptidase P family protein [Candidatus Caenarcaniphilales bacterium]|nr:aminopeptidase P family protein [Candidatus Caenarcaniphilales bacterium]